MSENYDTIGKCTCIQRLFIKQISTLQSYLEKARVNFRLLGYRSRIQSNSILIHDILFMVLRKQNFRSLHLSFQIRWTDQSRAEALLSSVVLMRLSTLLNSLSPTQTEYVGACCTPEPWMSLAKEFSWLALWTLDEEVLQQFSVLYSSFFLFSEQNLEQ